MMGRRPLLVSTSGRRWPAALVLALVGQIIACGGGSGSGAAGGSTAAPAKATGFSGPFYGTVQGTQYTTTLALDQDTVTGVIDDMKFSARVKGADAAGDVFLLNGQQVGVVKLALAGDQLTVDVTIKHPGTGETVQMPTMTFARGTPPPPPPPPDPSLDARLVGQWRYTWTAASGGVSMAIDYWLILRGDGTGIHGKAK